MDKISSGKKARPMSKTTKMDERKKKPANRKGKTSEGNIGNPAY